MILPVNKPYSFKDAYILCFYPSLEDYHWIGRLQKNENSSIISLLSIHKHPSSMDIAPIRYYLDHFSHWIVVFDSENPSSELWFTMFMEKISGLYYPLFQEQLTFADISGEKEYDFMKKNGSDGKEWVVQGSNL